MLSISRAMRHYFILMAVAIAVITTSTLAIQKQQRVFAPLDHFHNLIDGAKAYLPLGSRFSLQLINTNLEVQFYTRYTMAGRLMYYPEIKTDTVLLIADKLSQHTVGAFAKKKILWHNEDSNMAYFLICSR